MIAMIHVPGAISSWTVIYYSRILLSNSGLRGLLMAVMMSAVISSLTSVFNSAGSVFTLDIWTRIRPKASQRELLIIGRYVSYQGLPHN